MKFIKNPIAIVLFWIVLLVFGSIYPDIENGEKIDISQSAFAKNLPEVNKSKSTQSKEQESASKYYMNLDGMKVPVGLGNLEEYVQNAIKDMESKARKPKEVKFIVYADKADMVNSAGKVIGTRRLENTQ